MTSKPPGSHGSRGAEPVKNASAFYALYFVPVSATPFTYSV